MRATILFTLLEFILRYRVEKEKKSDPLISSVKGIRSSDKLGSSLAPEINKLL